MTVKRYGISGFGGGMVAQEDGAFYHMDDYDALLSLNAELLEALVTCHGALRWVIEQGGGQDCEHDAGVCFCRARNALGSASDAIAKARSQS